MPFLYRHQLWKMIFRLCFLFKFFEFRSNWIYLLILICLVFSFILFFSQTNSQRWIKRVKFAVSLLPGSTLAHSHVKDARWVLFYSLYFCCVVLFNSFCPKNMRSTNNKRPNKFPTVLHFVFRFEKLIQFLKSIVIPAIA